MADALGGQAVDRDGASRKNEWSNVREDWTQAVADAVKRDNPARGGSWRNSLGVASVVAGAPKRSRRPVAGAIKIPLPLLCGEPPDVGQPRHPPAHLMTFGP